MSVSSDTMGVCGLVPEVAPAATTVVAEHVVSLFVHYCDATCHHLALCHYVDYLHLGSDICLLHMFRIMIFDL